MDKIPNFKKFYISQKEPLKEARGYTIKELRLKAYEMLKGLGISAPNESQIMQAVMNLKSVIKDNKLGIVIDSNEEILEGAMSEIHMMAKKSKSLEKFKKMFMEEFGDKLEGAKDLDTWIEQIYNDMK